MSRQLPQYPNLEHLRKQAKDRLVDLQRQNPTAKLADAQHAIAVEYGFANWSRLKAHVETLAFSARPVAVPAAANPFVGDWIANLSKSKRLPDNPFQRATLEFAMDGDTVTVTDVVLSASGREEQRTNTLRADGREHSYEHGYAIIAGWRGARVLEAEVKRNGQQVSRLTYEVSADGMTLTIAATVAAHDG